MKALEKQHYSAQKVAQVNASIDSALYEAKNSNDRFAAYVRLLRARKLLLREIAALSMANIEHRKIPMIC